MTVRSWLIMAREELTLAGIPSSKLESEILLGHSLGLERSFLLSHPDEIIAELPANVLLGRRLSGEPLAYLLGFREFYGRRFSVNPDVLIPRHETEEVVEAALGLPLASVAVVVDVGTGSGCIAVTCALERPRWQVFATDISARAIQVASRNADALGASVQFVVADLLGPLVDGMFDLLISNPPYIGHEEVLESQVADHEPALALFAEDQGLAVIRRLAQARSKLKPGGWIVMEMGHEQGEAVADIFREAGWASVEVRKDLGGRDRILVAKAS
jgi:release factor glutamine methyltransferase